MSQILSQHLKGGLELHAHLSFLVCANSTRVTEIGTRSHAKAKCCILPRPRRCFLWPSQGPGVTHSGTSSVSCPEAWASSPVANSLDIAMWSALTPLSATCLQGHSAAKACGGPPWALGVQGKGAGRTMGSSKPSGVQGVTPLPLPSSSDQHTGLDTPGRLQSLSKAELGFLSKSYTCSAFFSVTNPPPQPRLPTL